MMDITTTTGAHRLGREDFEAALVTLADLARGIDREDLSERQVQIADLAAHYVAEGGTVDADHAVGLARYIRADDADTPLEALTKLWAGGELTKQEQRIADWVADRQEADNDGSEIDMDEVVAELALLGVKAYVEQTGGGCATIYAGEPFLDPDGDRRYPGLAGPGFFAGPGWTLGRGHRGDFTVGPDDDGSDLTRHVAVPQDATEYEIAWMIVHTMAGRPALDADGAVPTGPAVEAQP